MLFGKPIIANDVPFHREILQEGGIYFKSEDDLAERIQKQVPISCNWNSQFSRLSILRDGLRTLKLLSKKLLTNLRRG